MKEIGSEYWEINGDKQLNNLEYFNFGKDTKYLFCGRTAISYVIDNLDDNKKIVYMPDYCCDTMVIPFVDKGYKIKYYECDVINNNYQINVDEDCSVFYAMSYFGYADSNIDKYIIKMKERNIVVIEDVTHRLLESNNHCKYSDFVIASLRKWFPIYDGAIAVNIKNKFSVSLDDYVVDNQFLKLRKAAMKLKQDYLFHNNECKDEYLEKFEITNQMFEDYEKKLMDDESLKILKSLDINDIINKRYNNAKIIEEALLKVNNIRLLYHLNNGDCPLFVPVILKNRDKLKKELINNQIYCPNHWPNFNNFKNLVYDMELSLICDQRYNTGDIECLIAVINKFMLKEL